MAYSPFSLMTVRYHPYAIQGYKVGVRVDDEALVASFPGTPTIQLLITCSMQKTKEYCKRSKTAPVPSTPIRTARYREVEMHILDFSAVVGPQEYISR